MKGRDALGARERGINGNYVYLLVGLYWRRADDPQPVHSSCLAVCICSCGPTVSPFRASSAGRHGAHVFFGGNRRRIRRTLGRTSESRRTLCGDAHFPALRGQPALPFPGRTFTRPLVRAGSRLQGSPSAAERCRKVICAGNFDGIALGSLCRPDSRFDLDRSGDSGPGCPFVLLATVFCAGCSDLSRNCAFCRQQGACPS